MPYGVGHYSRYESEYIYLEEDEGQFKIQRRSRFRLHPGIANDTRDGSVSTKSKVSGGGGGGAGAGGGTGGGGDGATGVLAFHGWEKGSPIIANRCSDSDDEHQQSQSVLNCIKMECSSSSRDSTSTSPFIEHYKLPEMDFSSTSSSSESEGGANESSEHPTFTDPSETSQLEEQASEVTSVVMAVAPPETPPPLMKNSTEPVFQTEQIQRRKKAIYRRHESQIELDGRKARMTLALERRKAALEEAEQAEEHNGGTEHNVLSSTALAFSGDRHGTFVGRPSTVTPCETLYPRQYRHITAERRALDYSDLADAVMRPLPPTKIQISVLDVVPAVWASAFVERREFKKKVRHSLNTGEMSHAEVARRTEKALKRQEERQAEREQRRLRLAEARAARERGEVTPKAKRSRSKAVIERPKPTTTSPPIFETPKKRRRKRQAEIERQPVDPVECVSEDQQPEQSRACLERAISYSARVFAAVEKEIQNQINTSPKRHQRMRSILGSKVKQESPSSYENKLVEGLGRASRQNALLWNNIVPFETRNPKTKPTESILTKNQCEAALQTFKNATENRKLGSNGLNSYSFGGDAPGGGCGAVNQLTRNNAHSKILTPPKNLRKLSKDYTPKSDFIGSIPDRAAGKPPEAASNQAIAPVDVPDTDMNKPISQAVPRLRTRNKSVK